jgi:hypothetical protein
MAFVAQNLFISSGTFNAGGHINAPAIHTYTSDTDELATILTPGYFPDNLDANAGDVKIGDIIFITASDTQYIGLLTSVSPITIVAYSVSSIDQQIVVQDQTASGPWDADISTTITYLQIGKFCSIKFPTEFDVSSGTPGIVISFSEPIPAAALPSQETTKVIGVLNNSAYTEGFCIVKTDGTIQITLLNNETFSATGNIGYANFCMEYQTV